MRAERPGQHGDPSVHLPWRPGLGRPWRAGEGVTETQIPGRSFPPWRSGAGILQLSCRSPAPARPRGYIPWSPEATHCPVTRPLPSLCDLLPCSRLLPGSFLACSRSTPVARSHVRNLALCKPLSRRAQFRALRPVLSKLEVTRSMHSCSMRTPSRPLNTQRLFPLSRPAWRTSVTEPTSPSSGRSSPHPRPTPPQPPRLPNTWPQDVLSPRLRNAQSWATGVATRFRGSPSNA